ncbi:hypothetical protein SXCC_01022 [Gluconacetobacter sp. SXCC-1]|nr:hypothetical protein SXCC_01022 [Gluconacetobacter sp. SXCC-1]
MHEKQAKHHTSPAHSGGKAARAETMVPLHGIYHLVFLKFLLNQRIFSFPAFTFMRSPAPGYRKIDLNNA